jgi:transposase InsO family protein
VQVKTTNTILAQDGAHLGRDHQGRPIEAQLAKDRASQKIVMASIGPPTEEHVLRQLEELKQTRGLPLVWSTDNGSAYCGERVARFLDQERVIHLRNLPRTPEHNGSIERAVREVKEASVASGRTYEDEESAGATLKAISGALNSSRYRNGNANTANRLDEEIRSAYNLVKRDRFYAECRSAMYEARSETLSWRAKRMAERRAVFATLEKHQLVTVTIGGR